MVNGLPVRARSSSAVSVLSDNMDFFLVFGNRYEALLSPDFVHGLGEYLLWPNRRSKHQGPSSGRGGHDGTP